MKDKAFTIKTKDGYKTVGGLKMGKYGQQAYLTPDGHKLLTEWLKAPPSWFNMNVKEFEAKHESPINEYAEAAASVGTDAPF